MGVLTERRQVLVNRLRDGSFPQTIGGLERTRDPVGNCCLGVATLVAMEAEPDKIERVNDGSTFVVFRAPGAALGYVDIDRLYSMSVMIDPVVEYFGFVRSARSGVFTTAVKSNGLSYYSLISLNDEAGWNFEQIAGAIVDRQDELFIPDPDGSRIS